MCEEVWNRFFSQTPKRPFLYRIAAFDHICYLPHPLLPYPVKYITGMVPVRQMYVCGT